MVTSGVQTTGMLRLSAASRDASARVGSGVGQPQFSHQDVGCPATQLLLQARRRHGWRKHAKPIGEEFLIPPPSHYIPPNESRTAAICSALVCPI